jgi:branched-chain amino acid transport system substrate-binding protein
MRIAVLGDYGSGRDLGSGAATSELTGDKCSPVVTHWADDTYALSAGLVGELSRRVGRMRAAASWTNKRLRLGSSDMNW